MICDHLVVGIPDKKTSEQLQMDLALTLEKAKKMIRGRRRPSGSKAKCWNRTRRIVEFTRRTRENNFRNASFIGRHQEDQESESMRWTSWWMGDKERRS